MKKQSPREALFRVSPVFAALTVMGFACAPSVPLQNRPCPCADGWVCCSSGNVCAESADSCPGANGTAGTGGAMSMGSAGAQTPMDASVDVQTNRTPPPPDAGLPTLPNPTYTVTPTLLGTWTGYFENFEFPSKSDNLSLSMSRNADGSGKVTVVLGMGPPPAPPTSASATWPPTANENSTLALVELAGTYIEGFVYDAYEVQWDGDRLRFVINGAEPWQPYCQLQTSYYAAMDSKYVCVPGGSGGGSGNPDGSITCRANNGAVYSCEQVFACDQLCACDAVGCGAAVSNTTAFDITFTGPKGEGNVTIANGDGRDVMLTQVGAADAGQD